MPKAWVLDLSRLASRIGQRQLTGVDRFELAWCNFLIHRDEPVFGLVRTWAGFLLLDRRGLEAVARIARTGASDTLTTLRSKSVARCSRVGLARMLRRRLPAGAVYLNLAHSNVKPGVFRAFDAVVESRCFIFVHDVIPLSHPETQRPHSGDRMRRILACCRGVDGVISSANATLADIQSHLSEDFDQNYIVAPLGPFLPKVKSFGPANPPNFVAIGTIEPRKAHHLLFDVWDSLIKEPPVGPIPHLKIIGARGWESKELFDRLDRLKATGYVSEVAETDDHVVASHLAGAHGLLFPSIAEGFGVPAFEAAIQGIVPICAQLPVFHEVLGDIPVYVKTRDPYSWRTTILHMMDKEIQTAEQARINALVGKGNLPTWEGHFNTVLTAID